MSGAEWLLRGTMLALGVCLDEIIVGLPRGGTVLCRVKAVRGRPTTAGAARIRPFATAAFSQLHMASPPHDEVRKAKGLAPAADDDARGVQKNKTKKTAVTM